jgi:hypothetical protein
MKYYAYSYAAFSVAAIGVVALVYFTKKSLEGLK